MSDCTRECKCVSKCIGARALSLTVPAYLYFIYMTYAIFAFIYIKITLDTLVYTLSLGYDGKWYAYVDSMSTPMPFDTCKAMLDYIKA